MYIDGIPVRVLYYTTMHQHWLSSGTPRKLRRHSVRVLWNNLEALRSCIHWCELQLASNPHSLLTLILHLP